MSGGGAPDAPIQGADQSSEAKFVERVTSGAVTNPYPSECHGMTEPV